MTPFEFQVADKIFDAFPDYLVGCVVARGVDDSVCQEDPQKWLDDACLRSRASYRDIDLKSIEQFAVWREAFSRAGWSASRYPASVEALHKRVQRGQKIQSINTVVDLANAAVLFYTVPIGAHDIASVGPQPLIVRPATGIDNFVDMSGHSDPPEQGEIVYAAGADVRTRRWVWRQSRSALLGPDARDIFFPIDGFSSTAGAVNAASNYIDRMCREHLGATTEVFVVNSANRSFSA